MTDRKSTKQIAREAQAEKSFAKWQDHCEVLSVFAAKRTPIMK
jgi:hypothetical protein